MAARTYRLEMNKLLLCRDLGAARQHDSDGSVIQLPLAVSGPMWLGPLHDVPWLQAMSDVADDLGWCGTSVPVNQDVKTTGPNPQRDLEELLPMLQAEADVRLPPWFVKLDELSRQRKGNTGLPRRDRLVAELRDQGHAASASHVEVCKCPVLLSDDASTLCSRFGIGASTAPALRCGGRQTLSSVMTVCQQDV